MVDGGLEGMDPHWYHINYVNFKTWEFTLLRLMHVDTYPEMNEMTGANQDVYELEVHEHPQVSTSHRFFANLDLHLRYRVSWFTIISDDKPVFKDLFRAKTVCVSETTLEGVCDSYAWHGEISEEQRRTDLENQKKSQSKRAASRRTGHSQRNNLKKETRTPESNAEGQNHLLDLEEEEEEEEEVQPGDLNQEGEEGEEEEPEFDQLVDFAEMGLGLSSGDQEGAQDQDGTWSTSSMLEWTCGMIFMNLMLHLHHHQPMPIHLQLQHQSKSSQNHRVECQECHRRILFQQLQYQKHHQDQYNQQNHREGVVVVVA